MGGSYTDLPDYEAYENSVNTDVNAHVVTTIPGTYGNYIFFDLGVYARATPEEQSRTEEILLNRAGEKSPEARSGMEGLLDMAKEGATLSGAGGGTIIGGLDISVMDDRSASLETRLTNLYGREVTTVTPAQEQLYLEYTRHHENAHLMLNLKEPGADFVAAVTFLRQHPEARDTLQTISDMRIVDGFKDGPAGLARYGVESHEAMERALSLTPEQIRNTSTETLYTIALEYDQKNELNKSLMEESPEGQVFDYLNDKIANGANKGGLIGSWEVAARGEREVPSEAEKSRDALFTPEAIRSALQNNTTLNGETRDIANATIGAVNRLDSFTQTRPETPSPASAPVSQKNNLTAAAL